MKAHELWQTIQRMEKKVQRNRLKRFLYTVLLYAVAVCVILYWQGQFEGLDLWGILWKFVVCFIQAGVFVLLSTPIFDHLNSCDRAEDNMLKSLRKQYHEACEKEKGSGKNDRVPKE